VASTLNDFAFHYKVRKDLDKAERLFKKCIDIRVRELGENHLHVADAYEHVHWIYKDSKRKQDAVVALEHALKIRKDLLPANDQAIKNNYELLAHLYFELGQNELAQNALLNARK
jgi:tetratricopeptide (TPR) repeat protein